MPLAQLVQHSALKPPPTNPRDTIKNKTSRYSSSATTVTCPASTQSATSCSPIYEKRPSSGPALLTDRTYTSLPSTPACFPVNWPVNPFVNSVRVLGRSSPMSVHLSFSSACLPH